MRLEKVKDVYNIEYTNKLHLPRADSQQNSGWCIYSRQENESFRQAK